MDIIVRIVVCPETGRRAIVLQYIDDVYMFYIE